VPACLPVASAITLPVRKNAAAISMNLRMTIFRLRNASGRAGFVQERSDLFGRLGLRVGMALSRDCEQALSLFTDCVRLTRKRLSHRDAADLGV
jgi:hypothetical protein